MNQILFVFSIRLLSALLSLHSQTLLENGEVDTCNGRGTRFKVAKSIPTGELPSALATGDFNGDQVLDVAVADLNRLTGVGNISIYLGNGQGDFAPAGYVSFAGQARNIAVGDFNSDGKDDLAFAGMSFIDTAGDPKIGVGVALGLGDGNFSTPQGFCGGNFVVAVAVGDLNGDGKPDLAAVDPGTGMLLISLRSVNNSFSLPTSVFTGSSPSTVLLADFNKDSRLDIAVNNQGSSKVSIFSATGNGGFSAPAYFDIAYSNYMTILDTDQDGNFDIVFVNGQSLGVLHGNGAGNFTRYSYPLSASSFGACVMGDYNRDGKPDIAFIKPGRSRGGVGVALANAGTGYAPVQYIGAGYTPSEIASGDFNRDGKLDLLTINTYSNDISFLPGDGQGNFSSVRIADTGNFINSLLVKDLNQDGLPDLVVTDNTNKILLSPGKSDLAFEKEKEFSNPFKINGFPYTSIAEDFNQDGKIDLVVLNQTPINYTQGVVTFLPDIGFPILELTPSQLASYKERIKTSNTGAVATDMRAADFNGDGKQDLVLANSDTNQVTVIFGDGAGGFTVAGNYPVGTDPRSLTIGDLNGDGKPDIAVANRGSVGLMLLLNNGSGSFTSTTISTSFPTRQVVSGDMNLDGKIDLVVVPVNTPFLYVYPGTGNGMLGAPLTIPMDLNPHTIALGDFTNDGKLDLAVSRYQNAAEIENKVSIYQGNGKGAFTIGQEISVPAPIILVATDVNQDGLLDLAVATSAINGTGSVWILRNGCQEAFPANGVATVNSASYTGITVAPASIAAGFGTGLSDSIQTATTLPLPTKLAATTVTIKDSGGVEQPAPLFFVSPFQVNYQIPSTTAPGVASITIMNGSTKTSSGTILVTTCTPGIFAANADGSGVAAANIYRLKPGATEGNYEDIALYDPLLQRFKTRPISFDSGTGTTDTLYLLLYGTGIRGRNTLADVNATVWGIACDVEYAGPHCCFAGVDQVNIKLSPSLRGRGEGNVVLRIAGKIANTVKVNFQ